MPPLGGTQTVSAAPLSLSPRSATLALREGPQAVPTANSLSGVFSTAQAFGPSFLKGDAKLAAQSVVFTGEPISTAIATGLNFLLGKNNQQKQAKAGRLAASTVRDKGVSSFLGNFFSQYFDPNDPETGALISAAESDISNPDSENRGGRQAALAARASEVYARQLSESRALLPTDSSFISFPRGDSADALAGTLSSGIVLTALDNVSKAKGNGSTNDVLKKFRGPDYAPNYPSTDDFFSLYQEIFPNWATANAQENPIPLTAEGQAQTPVEVLSYEPKSSINWLPIIVAGAGAVGLFIYTRARK